MDIVGTMIAKKHGEDYINQEMVTRIDQIEDEMMNPKEWQLTGEVRAGQRPKDSLLQIHVDFNTVSKLPPTVNKETTSAIEALIKQRVLDELFDDPVLIALSKKKKLNQKGDNELDFTKNK